MQTHYWAAMPKSVEPDPIDNFIDQMGLITQEDGAPPIAGRILGLLLVEGRPLTLNEMASRLHISKASASTNARLLAARGLVRLTDLTGDRQDYYEIVPSPYRHILTTVSARMSRAAERVEAAERLIPEDRPEAKHRIRHLADFYRQSADVMAEWSANLKIPD